ncbi:phenolic acid decarboxylase [Actinobacteria bacterium YIM 96077]|uniref:Phenolic acid decarboxylase n=1 Tax=Phytoactinopolyspora halophila TaxID=1981511 RepID=A0A329QA98_9ACTN|nr:phenolic acid decarboxylase [Phytoactinopolyspora halophila]AYY13062.1 phenolic acid decarboxylase [Actinobacteria bacterium YIM 96077]RAW09243.1 phenolic acid decarboxylase [Phytoactinopolyspora halophila]
MTTTVDNPEPPQHLSGVVGYRFIYTYSNGWTYEMYVKNATTIDYRIHSGMVGGRWVKDQQVDLVMLTEGVFKISWTEPTGTSVCVTMVPDEGISHGVIFFPRWVEQNPERTVLFQNDHLAQMREYRDRGPTYPIHVVSKFAKIIITEYVGPDDENAIACSPDELPAEFTMPRETS